jgi:UDP-xylose/UDP-N-acetylglucosamine transporter B4
MFLLILTKLVNNKDNLSIKGFIMESKFGTKKSAIPLSNYTSLVVMFFIVSVLNNYALNFNISMPLHMIFRSVSSLFISKYLSS